MAANRYCCSCRGHVVDPWWRVIIELFRKNNWLLPGFCLFLPGTFGYGDEHENPYGSRSAMPQQYSSGPEGRFDDPSNMGRSGPYDGPPGDSYGHRGPSPGFGHEYDNGDPQQPRSPLDRPSPRAYENLGPPNMYNPDEGMMPRNMYGEPEDDERRPYPNERGDFEDGGPHLQGAPDEYDPNRRSPSVDSETRGRGVKTLTPLPIRKITNPQNLERKRKTY